MRDLSKYDTAYHQSFEKRQQRGAAHQPTCSYRVSSPALCTVTITIQSSVHVATDDIRQTVVAPQKRRVYALHTSGQSEPCQRSS